MTAISKTCPGTCSTDFISCCVHGGAVIAACCKKGRKSIAALNTSSQNGLVGHDAVLARQLSAKQALHARSTAVNHHGLAACLFCCWAVLMGGQIQACC